MDFLKEILGEELFAQVSEKINAHNGNEANKDSQIKLANLGGGEYVGKAKYDALQALLDGKGDETLQGKITAYEGQIQTLQQQLAKTQVESALKIALLEAGGTDIDYLMFKAQHRDGGKPLEMGDDGKIKGVDDLISGLKTQLPAQFKQSKQPGGVKVEANPLPSGDERKEEPKTLADALRLQYENQN